MMRIMSNLCSRNEHGLLGISSTCWTAESKIGTSFMSTECKLSRIGLHSAAYARAHASGKSHLLILKQILQLMALLMQIPFPSHVRALSVSSALEIASCHTPHGCTPFHSLIIFKDMSKLATSATLILMLCSGVLTHHAQMWWMVLKISRGTRFWSTMYMSK
ncbi:FluG domain-containing protein [Histoplasma capsulatum var. duboisii H88]|uniref:FluG domain-containing protein n=1 Tax=Ajellomyces capsulatus (strain H88) TaxID=544711 RepID=A0A8A1LSL1_AJEC8|nr:FluG domain-containing protein [Histoplasma capsulatum var. duboisii H88]